MQFRFERAVARAFYRRQRFIEDGDGAAWIAGPGLGLGQRNFQEPVEYEHVLRAQVFDAAAHVLDPSVGRSTLSRRPTLEKHPKRAVHGQLMLTGEWVSSTAFSVARAWSARINSNMAACILPIASVPICETPSIRVCMRSMCEIA